MSLSFFSSTVLIWFRHQFLCNSVIIFSSCVYLYTFLGNSFRAMCHIQHMSLSTYLILNWKISWYNHLSVLVVPGRTIGWWSYEEIFIVWMKYIEKFHMWDGTHWTELPFSFSLIISCPFYSCSLLPAIVNNHISPVPANIIIKALSIILMLVNRAALISNLTKNLLKFYTGSSLNKIIWDRLCSLGTFFKVMTCSFTEEETFKISLSIYT